jgi:hypothetical protein
LSDDFRLQDLIIRRRNHDRFCRSSKMSMLNSLSLSRPLLGRAQRLSAYPFTGRA